jgi:type II secretory pathway pseudopilin PulG
MHQHKKKSEGFTIIESVIVLFIIGLLTVTASVGFSRANREKIADQSSRKMSAELGKLRDSSFLGQKVNDIFPCGYALSIKKDDVNDDKSFWLAYTSGSRMDRLSVIDDDKICDEKIKDLSIELSSVPGTSPLDVSLGKARISNIDGSTLGLSNNLSCLTLLFSAPRQGSYYSTDCAASLPANFTFKEFSGDNKYFEVTFIATDRFALPATKILRISPSGNTSVVIP